LTKDDQEGLTHFQGLVKRTLGTVDQMLKDKQYLVGEKCTIADLAFVNWDLTLDVSMSGDAEAGTAESREKWFPNWAAWHKRILERPAVQKMIQMQKEANSS
jgi:glutathione S-transferase